MTNFTEELFRHISPEDAERVLGLKVNIPMTPAEMAKSLRVTFFPITQASERLERFAARLRQALVDAGAILVPFDEARDSGRPGRLQEHLIVIAVGEFENGNLPIDQVQSLRTTTIVGVFDGPCPASTHANGQEQLDSIVHMLAWNAVQIAIYVTAENWTMTTMNGAVISNPLSGSISEAVALSLIPKLAAPIVPPRTSDFEVLEGAFDPCDPQLSTYVSDFVDSGPLWQRSGLMLFHTSMSALRFRSPFYRRIVAAFLDYRSGMSYGFLARQAASEYRPRWFSNEAAEELTVTLLGKPVRIFLPQAWVITTRSGCDKSKVDPSRDLVLMGLSQGRVVLATPTISEHATEFKPSYDTRIILAHAVGNEIAAALLRVLRPHADFARRLAINGSALAHWHGTVRDAVIPKGYWIHGAANPPVSCSAPQAAFYALAGKIAALDAALQGGTDFEGDIHVEPHHGINVTGPSLTHIAGWVAEPRFSTVS